MVPLVGVPVIYVEKDGEKRAAFITLVHGDNTRDEVDLAFFRPVSERTKTVETPRLKPKGGKFVSVRERKVSPNPPQPGEVVGDISYAASRVPRCTAFDKKPGHWFWR